MWVVGKHTQCELQDGCLIWATYTYNILTMVYIMVCRVLEHVVHVIDEWDTDPFLMLDPLHQLPKLRSCSSWTT